MCIRDRLRTFLKKARLSLGGDNRLLIVMPGSLEADVVGSEEHKSELETLIENRIGKKVEVEVRHVEEGRDVYKRQDQDCGPANVFKYDRDGEEVLISTNREIDEIAMYTFEGE